MKKYIFNLGYFLLEVFRTLRSNFLSNLISVLGTGLILFLLALVATGWNVGDKLIDTLQGEAQISAYFENSMDSNQASQILHRIKSIEGVYEAVLVNETDAKSRMEDLLGDEAEILELFDENPFEAFIEVRINLDSMDPVLQSIRSLDGVEYVRDNRSVLEQMKAMVDGMKLLGSLIMMAVGITTLIIISHMIRQGIYHNREQIKTLRLLGASSGFIGLPFVLSGLLLTVIGGLIATGLILYLLEHGYQQLTRSIPFIPLPAKEGLMEQISVLVLRVSGILGFFGSLFGLTSIKKEENRG